MIEVKDLYKSFGESEVLKGLSLTVNDGETVVILGRSGVGKSVLLRHIMGLSKPDKGQVFVNGQEISNLKSKERYKAMRAMGMLFQGAALFDSMNVFENTAFYLKEHEHLSKEEIEERVKIALELVGLGGTQDVMPADLSGGMKKRAALARVIVYRPQIVLYDEPTTGLDPVTSMQINELINKTQKELKATSIVVTHDIRSAIEVGDRLALHHEGKIEVIAPKDEFLKSDHPLIRQFLENALIHL